MCHFSELSPAAVRVVDAAEGLVQQNGYNGFSYDDVAALVGIKKPGIHHHFPHKEELVAIVAQRYCHRFRERLLKIEGSSGAPIERLLAYSVLFEGTFSSERRLCLCGMLGAESDSLPASVVAIAEEFFGINVTWLTNVIRAGQGDGTLRTDTPPNAWPKHCCARWKARWSLVERSVVPAARQKSGAPCCWACRSELST